MKVEKEDITIEEKGKHEEAIEIDLEDEEV
jgi:hypothetical protein